MNKQITFLELGKKEVIRFIVTPQNFASEIEAIKALQNNVLLYLLNCGKAYSKYIDQGNPFVILIIHGINE